MTIQFTTYLPRQNRWVFIEEIHASIRAAKIRARVKGWSIIKIVNTP